MAAIQPTLSALMASSKEPCFSCLPPQTTVAEALSDMVRKKRTAVAITQDGQLKGIVTRTDLLKALDGASHHLPLSGIMTQTMVVAGPQHSLNKTLVRMTQSNIEHLPVVDAQRLLTVLHHRDLLQHQIDVMNADISYLQDYIEGLHDAEQD